MLPTAMPVVGTYSLLWHSSNSPFDDGATHCDMNRFLGYHAGPHGTGWRLKSQAIPLATGAAFHRGQQLMGEWILDWQASHPNQRLLALPMEVAGWAASEAAGSYADRARARGLQLAQNDSTVMQAVDQLISEQATLVEAMVWVWAIVRLPALLAQYRLVIVEREDGIVFDCTCGAGEEIADHQVHVARGCRGILYQTKADQIWQHVDTGQHLYVEFKGWGTINAGKEKAWEHSGQLLLNMEAASRRFGIPVDAAVVDVSLKGWRGRDRNDPPEAPKYQHTSLVYGYFDPGAPPFTPARWASEFRSIDEYGKGHTLPKSFNKVGVWEEMFPLDWGRVPEAEQRAGASRVERWVRGHLQPRQWVESVRTLGPFGRDQARMPLAAKGILAEERRWRSDVEVLREHGAVMPGDPMVDDLITRTWKCTHYDGTPCQFRRVCFREPGWENPEAMGMYEKRRPHHGPERIAVEALGHILPADEWEIEGGDDGE